MPEITAAMVKELREETQLPMMKCKQALIDADGDKEAAKKALREAGASFMDGRGDRATEEGRIAIFAGPSGGAIVELQVESAPVAGNEEVIQLAKDLAEQLATGPGAADAEALWDQPCPSKEGSTLREVRDDIINRIREVFRVPRLHRVDGPCGGYVHHDGKSGALLAIEGDDAELAKNIGMQVVAMKPLAVGKDDLDPEVVKAEEDIQKERARQEGKPENIIEKMIVGRMKNFFAEKVLEEQPYILDDKQTVGKVAAAAGLKLKAFTNWKVGETSEEAAEEPAATA